MWRLEYIDNDGAYDIIINGVEFKLYDNCVAVKPLVSLDNDDRELFIVPETIHI